MLIVRNAAPLAVQQPEIHGGLVHAVEFKAQRSISGGELYRLEGNLLNINAESMRLKSALTLSTIPGEERQLVSRV